MSRLPNASDAGERDSSVWMPVPLRAIVSSGAFESIVTVADFAPTVVGSKIVPRTLRPVQ